MNEKQEWVTRAKARAQASRAHEVEASRRAAELQETAAARFHRVRAIAEARNARKRAALARQMQRRALAEADEQS